MRVERTNRDAAKPRRASRADTRETVLDAERSAAADRPLTIQALESEAVPVARRLWFQHVVGGDGDAEKLREPRQAQHRVEIGAPGAGHDRQPRRGRCLANEVARAFA